MDLEHLLATEEEMLSTIIPKQVEPGVVQMPDQTLILQVAEMEVTAEVEEVLGLTLERVHPLPVAAEEMAEVMALVEPLALQLLEAVVVVDTEVDRLGVLMEALQAVVALLVVEVVDLIQL